MCPFPIYPLYTRTVILSLDKPIADCFLFRPRKRLEKCRKRSHTNVSNASITRTSTPPAQSAHVRFRTRKRVHTRLSEKDRTQRLTRRNRGRFGWGCYYYPRTVSHVSETLRGQGVERQTLPLLGLGWGVLPKNAESLGTAMRSCVSLFRGVAAPLGCVTFFSFVEITLVRPTLRAFYTCKVWGCYHCSRYAWCIAKVFRAQVSKRLTFAPTVRS